MQFVWRQYAGRIQLATYSYDNGTRPYGPTDPNLLQPFSTILNLSTSYRLHMHVEPGVTSFALAAASGTRLESKSNLHANACANAAHGYKLGFYFGGQCPAPQPVTACYRE